MKKIFLYALVVAGGLLHACDEAPIGQTATDHIAPGVVKDVQVTNLPGAAMLSYTLPLDEDLLYVKAEYMINGKLKDSRSSSFNNFVKVEGFGKAEEQVVNLYCVDRSENVSEPVEVKVHPTTPPVTLIQKTLRMQEDFGGIHISWKNDHKADVAIVLMAADSMGRLDMADVVYSSAVEGEYSLRGFDTTRREFAVYVRDHWDNYSDTLSGEFTPFFEVKLNKSAIRKTTLPGDNNTVGWGWQFVRMFDDIVGDQGWHTSDGNKGKRPTYFTFDFGKKVKLSRYKLWHRQADWQYRHHNPKYWEVWGSNDPNFSELSEEYWTAIDGGWREDWTKLLDCYSYKPSGDGGAITNEDKEYAAQGFEFVFPLDAPPVRFMRFVIKETWGGGTDLHISELSFWGREEE